MKLLVICRPAPNGDQSLFGQLIADEFAALRGMKESGTLSHAYSPGKPGAVLILDVPNPAAATSLIADLPLAAAGLITTEIIPLHPLDL